MAKVILEQTDSTYTISSNNTTVFGTDGEQVVTIAFGVTGTVFKQTVERVVFQGASSDYTYKNVAGKLEVYSGTTKVATINPQGDASGTQLTFTDGTTAVKPYGDEGLKLGNATVSTNAPAAVDLTGQLDTSLKTPVTSGSCTSGNNNGGTSTVNVSGNGQSDASTGNITYKIAAGNYTHTIKGFDKGDVLSFPSLDTLDFDRGNSTTDGTITMQYADAASGTIANIVLTGLAKEPGNVDSFKALFGANSIIATGSVVNNNGGNNGGNNNGGTSTVNVSGNGQSDASAGNITYKIAAGNYTHTISGFAAGDILDFPSLDTLNFDHGDSTTDGTITIQYSDPNSGATTNIVLTGLANESSIHGPNSFKTAFGEGSLV